MIKVTFRMETAELERLQRFAEQQDLSIDDCMRRFIRGCHIVEPPSIAPVVGVDRAAPDGDQTVAEVERYIDGSWWLARWIGTANAPRSDGVQFLRSSIPGDRGDGWREVNPDEVPEDVQAELKTSLRISGIPRR